MSYQEALKYIYSREKFGIKLGLSNIQGLLKDLGHPEDYLDFIHVAGTNGKGSVCAMISSVLQKQGYKVGMYTSPHLVDFTERIQINNERISKKDLTKLVKKISPHITSHTFFEAVTALAFQYFKEKKVDFVVAEVGMGGRLDATNAIKPLISVITNISLEHKEYLGDTIEKIAFEKAGIIKKGVPCVTAATGEALDVIKDICSKRKSKLSVVRLNKNIKTNLNGYFQLINASTCLKVIDALRNLGFDIFDSSISKGLMKVVWPARMHFIYKNVLLDCAHNPAAVGVLAKEIKKLKYNNLILLTGILKDKNIKEMTAKLAPMADHIIITKPNINRAADPKHIAKFIKKDCSIMPDVKVALNFARSITKKNDLLLITGSIYTVGEAMENLI